VTIGNVGANKYKPMDGLLFYKGKIVVNCQNSELIKILVNEFHSTPLSGHSGIKGTMKRIRIMFYWKKMKRHVEKLVKEYNVCQKNKSKNINIPGLLQLLLIPERIWTDVAMDFITCLSKSQKYIVIYVVVDNLS